MTTCSRFIQWCLQVIMTLMAVIITGCSSDNGPAVPKNNVPAFVEARANQLISDLTAQGYQVTRGYFKLFTEEDCVHSYQVMKSCYGNNPAAPYVTIAVQRWNDEYLDIHTINAFGITPEGYSYSFRFDSKEAIVILGVMPPQAAYYGLQTYQFTHEGRFDTGSVTYQYIAKNFPAMLNSFFTVVPNNPERIELFASLSNSNNNVVIERQSGASFDIERFFIITPDKYMNSTVREAMNRQSISAMNIFTEPIPSTMSLGLNKSADDFVFIMRYAMPQDGGATGTASDKWRKDLPLVVLRVRDVRHDRPAQPYGSLELEARTASDESGFTADLASLVASVSNRWGQPCTKSDCSDRATGFIDLQSDPINFVGPRCAEIGMNCLGDTQDTSYQGTMNLTIDNGEIYAVAGTLGTETGNAAYVGLSVNESLMIKGIENISSYQLKDTAKIYFQSTNMNAGRFYVYYFTRDCSGLETLTNGNCFSVTKDMIPVCSGVAGKECDYMKIVQRRYIKPGTQRGPMGNPKADPPTKLLSPMLIKLKKP